MKRLYFESRCFSVLGLSMQAMLPLWTEILELFHQKKTCSVGTLCWEGMSGPSAVPQVLGVIILSQTVLLALLDQWPLLLWKSLKAACHFHDAGPPKSEEGKYHLLAAPHIASAVPITRRWSCRTLQQLWNRRAPAWGHGKESGVQTG